MRDSEPPVTTDPADDGVLEAARAIRPYLRDLVGPAEAGTFDRRIGDLLTGPADRAATALRALLEGHEDTAWFLDRVLADRPLYRPPYQQTIAQRDITRPAGDPGGIGADRYICPTGDYVWYRPDVGTRIPNCPDHGVALVRG